MPTLKQDRDQAKNRVQDENIKDTSKFSSDGELNTGFPFTSPINPKIQEELEARTGTDDYGNFQRGKVAWCRFISNVGGEVLYPTELIKDNNSQGGILPTSFDQNYRQSYSAGPHSPESYTRELRPPAGITGISIDHQSRGGSLRKATINWTCHSLRDLNRLERSFMSPGVSVVLEWGWDKAFTLGKDVLLNLSGDDSQVSKRIQKLFGLDEDSKEKGVDRLYKKILDLRGNYDAMFGIITNFEWSMTSDGSYECTTEVMSKGFLMKSLETNDQLNKVRREENEKVIRSIKEYVLNKVWEDVKQIDNDPGNEYHNDVYIINERNYVTWRFIEEKIINENMNLVSDSGMEMPKMNSKGVFINNIPVLRTTDLDVCLITNGITIPGKTDDGRNFDSDGTDRGKIRNIWVKLDLVREAFNKSETLEESLMYMLTQISKAVQDYWEFDLQTYPDNGDMYVIDKGYVGKQNVTELLNDRSNSVYLIKTFGNAGNASSVNLQSKLSDKVAVTVMNSRNKQKEDTTVLNDIEDSAGRIFRGKRDRVLGNLDIKNETQESGNEEEQIEEDPMDYYDSVDWFQSEERNEPLFDYYPQPPEDLGRGTGFGALGPPVGTSAAETAIKGFLSLISERVASPSNLLEFLITTYEEENPEASQENNVIVPVELEVEIDGISGVRIGDVLHIDTLPNVYKETGVFQITGINESISTDNRWTKTLKCQFRISTKFQNDYEDKITTRQA